MNDDDDAPKMQAQISENLLELGPHIIYLGGVLPVEDLAQLRRMMIRVSKGKVLVYSQPFEVPYEDRLLSEPEYGAGVKRAVYVLAFEEGEFLTERVKKLASSFKDTKVARSETYEIKIESLFNDLNMHIAEREDCQRVIKSSRNVQRDFLK